MKGQYFSFDAIIAAVIFLLAVVALLSYWYSVKTYLDYQNEDLSKESVRVANILFSPPSSPDCTATGTSIGLAMSLDDRRLNPVYLNCFNRASRDNPAWLKNSLGSAYSISINVTQFDSDTGAPLPSVYIGNSIPTSPPLLSNDPLVPKEIVKLRRMGTFYNQTSGQTKLAYIDISVFR